MRHNSLFAVQSLAALVACFAFAFQAQSQCNEVFISEYIEGWSNNKALEVYNPTDAAIDLSGYRFERYSNGSTVAEDNQKVQLSGTVQPNDVMVFVLDKQDPDGVDFEAPVWDELAEQADVWLCPVYEENNAMYFNGNDAMVLRHIASNTVVDVFGKVGEDPGAAGWAGVTQNHTIVRKANVTQGDVNAIDEFLVFDQWDTLEVNTFDQLGIHLCDCGPANVSEPINEIAVDVFPNPSNGGVVFIRSHEPIQGVQLRNLAGQLLRHETVNMTLVHELNTASLLPGMYLVEIGFADGARTVRSIVRK